jgi:hypothetical protein
MITRKAFVLPLFLLFAAALSCAGNETKIAADAPSIDSADAKIQYDKAVSLWASAGASHYTARIQYGAFSPLAGEWTVEVKDKTAVHWTFKQTSDSMQHKDFASRLTMDSLFTIARDSLNNAAEKPFTIKASFDSLNGSVKDIAKIRNAAYKGNVAADKTFRYTVTELKIIK